MPRPDSNPSIASGITGSLGTFLEIRFRAGRRSANTLARDRRRARVSDVGISLQLRKQRSAISTAPASTDRLRARKTVRAFRQARGIPLIADSRLALFVSHPVASPIPIGDV